MWFVYHLTSFYYSDDSNAYVYSIVIVSLDDKRRRFPLFYSRLVINKGRSWEVKFVGILGESACWALLAGLLELWHGYRHPWRIRARFTRVGRMSYANHECTLVYSYYSPSFLRCWRLLVLHRTLEECIWLSEHVLIHEVMVRSARKWLGAYITNILCWINVSE